MLQKTIHLAAGTVKLWVQAEYPERFLNLCGANGIRFWGFSQRSENEFTLRMTRKDYAKLRLLTGGIACRYRIERREGLPFFARRFRRRQVLLAGLALCVGLMAFSSFFIWDLTVEGNETVSEERILRALEKNGVAMGTLGFSVDPQLLRNRMLLEIPELSWITVNVSGCRAYVQVRERVEKPEIVDEKTPCNVVAAKSGLVTKVMARSGTAMVLPGTMVKEGDLLISGVSDTDTVGASITAGMGSVTGRTWYRLSVPIARQAERKTDMGEEKNRFAVDFGRKRINFYRNNSSIDASGYDTIISRMRWVLPGGLALPISWIREQRTAYAAVPVELSLQDAKALGETILQEYLLSRLSEGGKVISTLCTVREEETVFVVTLAAECLEELGCSAEILHGEGSPAKFEE